MKQSVSKMCSCMSRHDDFVAVQLVDRGIDQEVTIIQVKKGKTRLIYKVRNESEEEWGEFLV